MGDRGALFSIHRSPFCIHQSLFVISSILSILISSCPSCESFSRHHSTRDEEVAAEAFAGVEPGSRALEAGLAGERGKLGEVVLVRALGGREFGLAKNYGEANPPARAWLAARALEVHLYGTACLVAEQALTV